MIRWLYYALRRWYYRNVYLRSGHWREVRRKAIIRAHYECQVSGCKVADLRTPKKWKPPMVLGTLDVHHANYRRLGREHPEDVVALCRFHHAQVELGYEMLLKGGKRLPGYKKYKVVSL